MIADKGFVTFVYKVGWRFIKISRLQWKQVDLKGWRDEGRTVCLDDELREISPQQWHAGKTGTGLSTFVFPNEAGTDGIKDFSGAFS